MVDYYVSVSYDPPRSYNTYAPAYRDESQKTYVVDSPLNLSLRDSDRTVFAAVDSTPENALESPVGELGNVLIVSDLDCDIAQEEVIETVECEDQQTEDTAPSSTEVSLVDPEEELAAQTARNAFLRSTCERLSEKVAKIRELLDSAVQRQKVDTEAEVRSESDFESSDHSGSHAQKRSRNNSWPQMSTINSNQRKKEQNKLASKRFRERKKMELARAQQDISDLEARNTLLRSKADSMQTEADNLKKILLELRLIKIVDLPSGQSTILKNI